jgi:hypothetical protein
MAILGILLAVYALLITPLRLRLDVAAGAHFSGAAVLKIWGIRLQANMGLIRDDEGKLLLALRRKDSDKQHSGSIGDTWQTLQHALYFLREADRTRAFFAKTITVLFVGLRARISFPNAAHTALGSGAASVLLSIFREKLHSKGVPCRLEVWPDFEFKPCAAQLSCILFMRLGNLLFGCAMAGIVLFIARIREKRREEDHAWSTPSET